MKIKLSRKSQKKQDAIQKALATGIPLAGLFSVTLFAAGCSESPARLQGEVAAAPKSAECAPVIRGDIAVAAPTPKTQTPEIPATAGVPIPPPPRLPDLPKETESYIVQPGDTLLKIARARRTDLDILLRLNGLSMEQANHLSIGQTIKVPLAPDNRNNETAAPATVGKPASPANK